MNCKTIWRGASALTAALTFSSLVALAKNAPPAVASSPATVFSCVQDTTGRWVTVAQKGKFRSRRPMLTWSSVEFGGDWPPKKRCDHVSDKLTRIVANNGGTLADLALTYGLVNNYMTICVAKFPDTCNANNMLFTLSSTNRNNPGEVLQNIVNFVNNKAGSATIDENGGLRYVLLEDVVEFDEVEEEVEEGIRF